MNSVDHLFFSEKSPLLLALINEKLCLLPPQVEVSRRHLFSLEKNFNQTQLLQFSWHCRFATRQRERERERAWRLSAAGGIDLGIYRTYVARAANLEGGKTTIQLSLLFLLLLRVYNFFLRSAASRQAGRQAGRHACWLVFFKAKLFFCLLPCLRSLLSFSF